jgi:hypothetical protein
MLNFDMEILRSLRAKELGAPFVRAHVSSIDLSGSPPEVLFSFIFGIWGPTRLVFGYS